jgi:two-component system chemotaxis response regulator CheB
MRRNPIGVLIVDDSASVRQAISAVLSEDPDIEVIGTAPDPFAAARRLHDRLPDVMVLDLEMPRMDGLTFLRKIMAQHPIPVVICSSFTDEGSRAVFEAFEAGAVDVVSKPRMESRQALIESAGRLRDAIKGAAQAKVRQRSVPVPVEKKLTADAVLPPPVPRRAVSTTEPIVCIGISTGGTETLRDVLQTLPAETPAIVVVQHMPEKFTSAFAKRLDGLCDLSIKEAEDGDALAPGRVFIAPGGRHMLLQRTGTRYHLAIKDGPPVSRHRPSVDVLFRSAASCAGANALGIIMTGMGDDGARGLLEMRNAGARTLAQDEDSCVVFGMPKEAIACGAAEHVVGLRRIRDAIIGWQAHRGEGS